MKLNLSSILKSLIRPWAAVAVMASAFAQAPAEPPLDLGALRNLEKRVQLVGQKCTPATVALLNGSGSGSGVVISADGLILTAAHVVDKSETVKVVFPDGTEADAKVLGAYYTRDIAMAKITSPGNWPHCKMGKSAVLAPGDWVVALGHAKGYDPNRRPPVRFARILQNGKRSFLLSDCTLIGGDSGGPLFNLNGEVVGIHSSIGNNLSINNHAPVDAFEENWRDLISGKKWGELGISPLIDPDSPVLGITMGASRRGIVVAEVVPGSPAAKAKLRAGDLLVQIEGNELRDAGDLLRELAKHEVGETIKLTIKRNGKFMIQPVTLMRRSDVFPNQ